MSVQFVVPAEREGMWGIDWDGYFGEQMKRFQPMIDVVYKFDGQWIKAIDSEWNYP